MFRKLIEEWRQLPADDRRKLRFAGSLVVSVLLSLFSKRALAIAAAATVSSVATATLVSTGSGTTGAAIKAAWLAKAGPYQVERVRVPCPGVGVNRGVPAKGVGHTTEGGWAGAMSVFRRHYAPHFMVGRDQGRVRIVQFCPLGEISAALKNRAGGVATNHDARAQVELVGFSQRSSWQADAGVMKAYAALLYALRDAAGIPLTHVPNRSRSAAVWTRSAGWFDHAGVPENDHWDMGAFAWPAAIKQAAAFAPVKNPGHAPAPVTSPPLAAWRVCVTARAKAPTVCRTVRGRAAAWSFASTRSWAQVVAVRRG